jgi:hypothetical protein
MSYTEVTIAGFDASPPPDDGSTGPTNQVKWATIKSKLFDPLKTALETIDDRVDSAVTTADTAVASLATSVTALATTVDNLTTTLTAPAGTVMLFQQTSAPTGWTKGSTYNDYALRAVTGTASTGGSTAFSSIFAARTIVTANLPSHTHTFSQSSVSVTFSGGNSGLFLYDVTGDNNSSGDASGGSTRITDLDADTSAISGTVSISGTTGSSGTGSTWDFAVQYVDFILATKG